MPEKIIKQTLSEQIYNILKEDILSGRILMGDKLTNRGTSGAVSGFIHTRA